MFSTTLFLHVNLKPPEPLAPCPQVHRALGHPLPVQLGALAASPCCTVMFLGASLACELLESWNHLKCPRILGTSPRAWRSAGLQEKGWTERGSEPGEPLGAGVVAESHQVS